MAFQMKSGGNLVNFFKNAGKKIKAAGAKYDAFKAKRGKMSAAKGGFKKFQADAAEMRKKGKSIFELQKIAAAATRAKNKKNEKEQRSGGLSMNDNMA